MDELIEAQNEWDSVECIEPKFKINNDINLSNSPYNYSQSDKSESNSLKNGSVASKNTPFTDFDEVWEFFMRQDMSQVMPKICPTPNYKGIRGIFRSIFGPTKLNEELVKERNLLFAIAQCSFNNDEPLHVQILMTIFKALTGTVQDCPRFGNHWDKIGFQGTDPATDLRGVGLLGIVQALYLVTTDDLKQVAKEIYALSLDSHSQFPLMVLSINVTRISLEALREGFLNKECNSQSNVRHVFNEFFAAVMFYIFWIWRRDHKTIKDSGFLVKDAENYCKKNTRLVFQRLRSHIRNGTPH